MTNARKNKETWLQRIEINENQKIVVEGYINGRHFLMIAPTGSGKSLIFHIAPFKNIHK